MSASSEKKLDRGQKRRLEEQKDRRAVALYSVIGAAVLIAAVVLLVWNSGLLQRNLTALNVNGTKYTAADVQYYYNTVYSTYGSQYAFDLSTSVKKQVYDQETGQTWYDFLLDSAVESLTNQTALAAKAKAEGFALTEESQAELDSFLAQLDVAWIGTYSSRDAFIKARFGTYMTYNRLAALASQEYLASDYVSAQLDAIEHSDADFEEYYQEHAGELDTVTYSLFTLQAQVPTVDSDGSALELTDAEKSAQLETLKQEQKALAEEVQAKLESGADPEAVAREYEGQLYNSSVSQRATGSSLSSIYSEWLLDSGRRAGDVTLLDRELTDSCYYYVLVYESRQRDNSPTADVRHILVAAEQDEGASEPTQAQYDAAYEQAQELLDQWKQGEATEESFTELAKEHSADSGVSTNEGLYTNINPSSSYVDTFKDWALDSSRRPGDTGIVQNTGSSTKGWHIMYFVQNRDPIWKQSAASALETQDYENLAAEAAQGWSVSQGAGMNLLTA